jgi:hypothetical protein
MPPPLSYIVLSHLHAPVTIYGFILPVFLYRWWAILFLPLAAQIGTMLDSVPSPDGSQLGNALTTATIFTLTAMAHEVASFASSSLSGFGGWMASLVLCYIVTARLGHRHSNFAFATFCSIVGIAAMAIQAANAVGSTSTPIAGGWWPLGLVAAGCMVSFVLALPGMPFSLSHEELEASMYAPERQGYGTAHHRELDAHAARSRHRRRQR